MYLSSDNYSFMRFSYLNLNNSRTLVTSVKNESISIPSRRRFVKAIGLGAISLNPLIKSIKKLDDAFEIRIIKGNLSVIRNKQPLWTISDQIFEPGYNLNYRKIENGHSIKAENLVFHQTSFHFSLSALILNQQGNWRFHLSIPELTFIKDVDFTEWLEGTTKIKSPGILKSEILLLNKRDTVLIDGKTDIELNNDWELKFRSDNNVFLQTNGSRYSTDQLILSPVAGTELRYLNFKPTRGTLIELPKFKGWNNFLSDLDYNGSHPFSSQNDNPGLTFFSGYGKSGTDIRLVWTDTDGGKITLKPETSGGSNYHFENYFYFAEYLNGSDGLFYLGASLPATGQWITNDLGSFWLEKDKSLPDFEAFGYSGKIEDYVLEPRLRAFKPRINNGHTFVTFYRDPENIRINLQKTFLQANASHDGPIISINDSQNTREIPQEKIPARSTTTSRPSIITQQQKPVRDNSRYQFNLDIEYDRMRFKPNKTLKIKVLRPEDMILLEFEFQNFNLTTKDQSSYLELDNLKEPGIVLIYFLSQHMLEEAYFESNPLPLPPNENGGNAAVKLPARHLRARKSRLVYELPAGHEGFPLLMEELLDWSKYKLRVHPRAWITTSSILKIKPLTYKIDTTPAISKNTRIRYLDTDSKDYSVRLAQNTKIRASGFAVYDEGNLDRILDPEPAFTIRQSFNISSIKGINLKTGPVDDLSTSIEAPALMYISPNQLNDFYHRSDLILSEIDEGKENGQKPATELTIPDPLSSTKGKITELWHTRLGVKLNDGKTSLSSLPHFKTIRALWADEADEDYQKLQPVNAPFMASLDASDRHILVHTTSNYVLGFTPFPVPVKNLMLTALGAYLDWHAFFDIPTPQDNYLNIIEWEHLATLGRDHYVKIVREGYLVPFGHRAALVKVTERKFNLETKSAVNRQRMYVVVIDKEVFYDRKDPAGKFIEFPFQVVRIDTTRTPDIDNPSYSTITSVPPPESGLKEINPVKSRLSNSGNTSYNFYINVNGQGFKFEIVATDKEGREHVIRMPLAFVENFIARSATLAGQIAAKYNSNLSYNETGLSGQEIAYSEFLADGDTAFETEQIKFGMQVYPALGEGDLKFHPNIQEAKIYISPIDELTGNREPVSICLEDEENPGGIFARITSETAVDFSGSSDKSGGFLTPNIVVSGLSKLQGPVSGKLSDLKKMLFKPLDFFEESSKFPTARIFGAIKIFDLLLGKSGTPFDLGGTMDSLVTEVKSIRLEIDDLKSDIQYLENIAKETKVNVETQINQLKQQIGDKVKELIEVLDNSIPRMPIFKSFFTDEAYYTEYKWQPQLESKNINIIPGLLEVKVDDPSKALFITTQFEKPFDPSRSASINGFAKFEKFRVDIVPLMMVNFNYLEFRTGSLQKTDVKVDIDPTNPIQFKGALSFVNNLQSIIPSTGFSDDGPYVKLNPTGVTAGFDLGIPNVTVGICMITNISLGAAVTLPFTGAPLTIAFNFCKRENPFLLTVSIYGGGGYFLLVTTLYGIQSMEAAFEFGAAVSLDVGVASGGVSIMGGFYFKIEKTVKTVMKNGKEEDVDVTEINLSGYLRINGHMSVLGIITLSLEFYLALEAKFVGEKCEKMEGVAILKVKVEVLFFSKTVKITVRRELKGADADPKFTEMVEPDDWQEYCLAFAS